MKVSRASFGRRGWLLVGIAAAGLAVCIVVSERGPRHAIRSEAIWQAKPPARGTGQHLSGPVHFDLLAKLLADDRRSVSLDEWWRQLADPTAPFRVETQRHPLVGQLAPEFVLDDELGRPFSLRNQITRGPVVLVFYLGNYCNACVHDLFELNADLERFHSLGAEVVAVSGDEPSATREKFAEFGALGFRVLSDPAHRVARVYGVYRPAQGPEPEKLLHGTFVIGHDGRVDWVCYGDAPFRDNMALAYELARLENKLQ
jgi:peroxiredoxin